MIKTVDDDFDDNDNDSNNDSGVVVGSTIGVMTLTQTRGTFILAEVRGVLNAGGVRGVLLILTGVRVYRGRFISRCWSDRPQNLNLSRVKVGKRRWAKQSLHHRDPIGTAQCSLNNAGGTPSFDGVPLTKSIQSALRLKLDVIIRKNKGKSSWKIKAEHNSIISFTLRLKLRVAKIPIKVIKIVFFKKDTYTVAPRSFKMTPSSRRIRYATTPLVRNHESGAV